MLSGHHLVLAGEARLRQLVGAVVGGAHLGPGQAEQQAWQNIIIIKNVNRSSKESVLSQLQRYK